MSLFLHGAKNPIKATVGRVVGSGVGVKFNQMSAELNMLLSRLFGAGREGEGEQVAA